MARDVNSGSSSRFEEWVGIACLAARCGRGCELVACEGPAEPGWTWIEEHGWVCLDCIGEWPSADRSGMGESSV
jgi:hypothetical protein